VKTYQAVLIAIVVLVLAALACGGDNTGEKVDEREAAPTATPGVETYGVGDVIQLKDHTIVLNEATIQGGALQANFTIENIGTDDLAVSSMLSFEAKLDDGTKLDQAIFDCPSSGLDGSVLSGDKLKGWICWSGASSSPVKIYYRASLLGSGAIVWEVAK